MFSKISFYFSRNLKRHNFNISHVKYTFSYQKENQKSNKRINEQDFKKQYLDNKEAESVMTQYENINDAGFSTFSSGV